MWLREPMQETKVRFMSGNRILNGRRPQLEIILIGLTAERGILTKTSRETPQQNENSFPDSLDQFNSTASK